MNMSYDLSKGNIDGQLRWRENLKNHQNGIVATVEWDFTRQRHGSTFIEVWMTHILDICSNRSRNAFDTYTGTRWLDSRKTQPQKMYSVMKKYDDLQKVCSHSAAIFFTADAWIGRNYFAAVSRHTASYFENQWKSEADKWHQPIDRAVNFADILYLSFDQSIDRPCNLKPIWGVTYLYHTRYRCNRMIFIHLIIMYPYGVLRHFTLTL